MSPSSLPPINPPTPPMRVGASEDPKVEKILITYLTNMQGLSGFLLPSAFDPNANPYSNPLAAQEFLANLIASYHLLEKLPPGTVPADVMTQVKTLLSTMESICSSATAPTAAELAQIQTAMQTALNDLHAPGGGSYPDIPDPMKIASPADMIAITTLVTNWTIHYAVSWLPPSGIPRDELNAAITTLVNGNNVAYFSILYWVSQYGSWPPGSLELVNAYDVWSQNPSEANLDALVSAIQTLANEFTGKL